MRKAIGEWTPVWSFLTGVILTVIFGVIMRFFDSNALWFFMGSAITGIVAINQTRTQFNVVKNNVKMDVYLRAINELEVFGEKANSSDGDVSTLRRMYGEISLVSNAYVMELYRKVVVSAQKCDASDDRAQEFYFARSLFAGQVRKELGIADMTPLREVEKVSSTVVGRM